MKERGWWNSRSDGRIPDTDIFLHAIPTYRHIHLSLLMTNYISLITK